MRQYSIAGHLVQISGKSLDSLPGFDFFVSEKTDNEPLLLIEPDDTLRDWAVSPVFTSEYDGVSYDLSYKNHTYRFRMKQSEDHCLLAEIRREGAGFRAAILGTSFFNDLSLQYACWILFGIAALSRQTVSIHASAVMVQGKSVLFLGESGTGKSTQTGLWLNHIPETELLNDDSPFIRVESDGNIRIYGSPWSGKTAYYKNRHTPVAAFIRLSQAPYNRIRRLNGIEAIAALLPSCPFAFAYDKPLSDLIYSIVSLTLRQVPVYHLECLPDSDAVRLSYSTLKQNGHL